MPSTTPETIRTEPAASNGRKAPRRLALSEALALSNWVVRYWPEIERNRPTIRETTEQYNRERIAADPANRPITSANLRHVVEELNLTWPNNPARRIAAAAGALGRKIDILADELHRLTLKYNAAEPGDHEHSPAFLAAFQKTGHDARSNAATPAEAAAGDPAPETDPWPLL